MDRVSGGANETTPSIGKAMCQRRVLGVACLMMLAAGLVGCDLPPYTPQPITPTAESVPTPVPEPTDAIPPGITQVVFWEPFPLGRPQGLLLGEMIRDFEEENPDLLIDVVPKGGYVGIHGAMMAELQGGELPDLAVAFPSMIAQYAAADVVAPLDPFVYDLEFGLTEEDLDDIIPVYLDAGRFPRFGQQVLAFPFAQNAVGMWVNQTLLRQAGWDRVPSTWDEFEQACFDVAASSGARCYPFVESVSTFNAWLYSRGGQVLDSGGRQTAFSGPAGVESLALLRRLMDAGLAWRPDEPYGDYVAFANGQAAFTFSSTGNSSLYVDAYQGALYGGVAPFQWRQAMIPQADPEQPATALYGASFFILKGDPDRELAAWRFVRWFTDTDQTARWAARLEAMPVRASALGVMTDTMEAYPFFRKQVEDIVPYARPEPAVSGELEIRDTLYTAIISVTQGFADPQTALEQAARDADTILSSGP